MRYIVTGADKETGKEMATTIDAAGKAEADKKAAELGWLISAVRPDVNWKPPPAESDVLDYAGLAKAALPMPIPQIESMPPLGPPDYHDLAVAADGMKGIGSFCSVGGALIIGLGVLAGFGIATNNGGAAAVTVVAVSIVGGLILIGLGAGLRILGALALAHRDIARNSFGYSSMPSSVKAVDLNSL